MEKVRNDPTHKAIGPSIPRPAGCQTALRRSPSVVSGCSCFGNKIIGQTTGGNQRPTAGTGEGRKGSRERNRRFRSFAQLTNTHRREKSSIGREPWPSKFQICLGSVRATTCGATATLILRSHYTIARRTNEMGIRMYGLRRE